MEVFFLAIIILVLSILMVMVIVLMHTVSKLKLVQKTNLEDLESNLRRQTDLALPGDMQSGFEVILQKHEKYLDELLRTTTNSFDRKIQHTLDESIHKQLVIYRKAIGQQQEIMVSEMKQMNESITDKRLMITSESEEMSRKIRDQYQQRLENHFAELAWQYISKTLTDSIDLHSQKNTIFKQLQQSQKDLKKDFSDADKVAK